jgi:hypothetical protein
MNEGSPPIDPGRWRCASKYGTAGPLEVSVGYHAWAMICRWSDGLAVSVSGRWLSVQRKISLPTLCGPDGLGSAGTNAVSSARPASARPMTSTPRPVARRQRRE